MEPTPSHTDPPATYSQASEANIKVKNNSSRYFDIVKGYNFLIALDLIRITYYSNKVCLRVF